jgi:hypothetical protein
VIHFFWLRVDDQKHPENSHIIERGFLPTIDSTANQNPDYMSGCNASWWRDVYEPQMRTGSSSIFNMSPLQLPEIFENNIRKIVELILLHFLVSTDDKTLY